MKVVLIEQRTSRGLVGRCDAKCYNAKHPRCVCICGGKNHGAGLSKAVDNTLEMAEEWIKKHGVDIPILPEEERKHPELGIEAYSLFRKDQEKKEDD